METRHSVAFGEVPGAEPMQVPESVAAMLRLKALGWGAKRIASELGCSRMTVKRYLRQGGWEPYRSRPRRGALVGLEPWLRERFLRHRGNADVVRQELRRELGVEVSLRTVERAVSGHRRELSALARATVRFETPPGKQLQIDFGETRIPIGDDRPKVFLFVATLGYSRRPYVATFLHEGQVSWLAGIEGAFRHFNGIPEELLLDNPWALVSRHDARTRTVTFNPKILAFARHWGFRSKACAQASLSRISTGLVAREGAVGSKETLGRAASRAHAVSAPTIVVLVSMLAMLLPGLARPDDGAPEQLRPSLLANIEMPPFVASVTAGIGNSLDRGHDWLYRHFQALLDDFDARFRSGDEVPIVIAASALRLGMDLQLLRRSSGIAMSDRPTVDVVLHVPNAERRLHLFVTNDDVYEMPRDPAVDQEPVRVGLRYSPSKNFEMEVGVRSKLWPAAFTDVSWSNAFRQGKFVLLPFGKMYAESGLGLGVSGGLAIDHWSGRWVTRSATYSNWVRNTGATDWSQTLILGYATAVIQQHRNDRLADGRDLACGMMGRVAIIGDRVSRATVAETSLLLKRPIRHSWLFLYAGPTVRWERRFGWHPDVSVAMGFDALFWGFAHATDGESLGRCRQL